MVTSVSNLNRYGKRMAMVAMAVAAVWVGDAQRADAQGGGGRGGFGRGRMVSRVALISLENVQADLKLTDEQKTKVTEINDKLSEERRALRQGGGGGGDFAARREQTEKLTQAATEKLNAVLDEAQRKRITEIYVQAAGTSALSDAEVVAALALTDDQKKQLTDLRDGYMEEVRGQFQGGGGGGGGFSEEQRTKMAELQKAWDDKMMAVLTEEQRQSHEKMKGAAIEIDLTQLRGFGGGRPGGGGGN